MVRKQLFSGLLLAGILLFAAACDKIEETGTVAGAPDSEVQPGKGSFEVTFFPGAGLLFSLSFYLVVLLPLAVQPDHLLSCLVQYHSFHHFSQPAWWVSPAV